jgi:putative acetyltransferase
MINIREIRPSDNQAVARIVRAAIEEFDIPKEGTAYTDPDTDNMYQLFQKFPKSIYLIAEEEGLLLGGCGISPTGGLPDGCAELVRFFLAKESRGKGIGKTLMTAAMDHARTLGYKQLYLESFPELTVAVSMYEKAGFRYLDHSMGNSGHYACNVWMLKDL